MAIQRGESSFITKDGVKLFLVMDLYAFAEAEDVTGFAPQALMEAVTPKIDPKTKEVIPPRLKALGGLLYGALKEHQPDITHADAIRLFGEGEVVGEAIAKALQGAVPKASPSAEGKVLPLNGTGTKPKKTGQQKG
ncbi:MAG: hypothetical protein ACSLE1_02945 [Sphingobium sp.]